MVEAVGSLRKWETSIGEGVFILRGGLMEHSIS